MPSHRVFFFASLFFLLGVFFKSVGFAFEIFWTTASLAVVFLVLYINFRNKLFLALIPLLIFIFAGSLYYQWDENKMSRVLLPQDETFVGVVASNPKIGVGVRDFKLDLLNPYQGSLLVKTSRYPSYEYGDKLYVSGDVVYDLDSGYKNYLAKRGISGAVYSPNIEKIGEGYGNPVKSGLYKARNGAYDSFRKVLSPLHASFINGLTLGGYNGFSDEFKGLMSKSGTTHLVALSGYNVSILIWLSMVFFLYFFSRRVSFWLVGALLVGFVLMTGAEASVVRAAIMGALTVVALKSGRLYDVRNALVFSALVMVLHNPKVLVYDVGFQLSFLAVLGIIYLRPVLYKLVRMRESVSFLNWKENLMVTASAQLAVVPILILNFESFSPVSLLANVSILELIPVTMFLGFVILLFSIIFQPLAFLVGWFVSILLKLEVGIIRFFGEFGLLLDFNMGWAGAIVYYLGLVALIYFGRKKFNLVYK